MTSDQLGLFDDESAASIGDGFVDPADRDARRFAVDPRRDVVLEASAGTGKTRVLVERYLNLLDADVQPANILAITFTRKAAAEMHERIVRRLREDARLSDHHRRRWLALRDRLSEIAVSTIDAFCLSLLREFPLEAGLDPGFDVADETEVPRLVELAIDRTLRVALGLAPRDADLSLALAQLGTWRARIGLSQLLERRLVARGALDRFLARGPRDLTIETTCARVVDSLRGVLETVPGGLPAFLACGPVRHPTFQLLAQALRRLPELAPSDAPAVRSAVERVRDHFLTQDGKPRSDHALHPYRAEDCDSAEGWRRHRRIVADRAPRVRDVLASFDRDLNALLARGVRKLFAIAETEYRRALDERSVLDFSDLLDHALALLRQMDEFAQSRFRLESRYHHVLVDEFQDTSRAQWELVELLIRSWGEGFGLVHDAPVPPSIFVVGDRKQSIYRFRDAEVTVLEEAAGVIAALKPGVSPRRSIRQSLRAVPGLLAFVNDVFQGVEKRERRDAFRYAESDQFPLAEAPPPDSAPEPVLGLAAAADPRLCASAVADEIARLCREGQVPDRETGETRPVRPSDIAILFRSRVSHREFEDELEQRGVATYVYKGLGFFDADEIKDLSALLRFLAEPASDLRAAALLRSRLIRLSDAGLTRLAPDLAAALTSPAPPSALEALTAEDRAVLEQARSRVRDWLARVDRVPPADLIDEMLAESAYAFELRGPRRLQAWENLKKLRALIRRIQNRGYATLAHIATHLDCLRAGDESNAVIEAIEAVNLMTVHAAKGLEFPIVFVVNLAKGVGAMPPPLRVMEESGQEPVVAVDRYVPEADEHEKAADLEETKRLLYVALTRARNRLYLATVLKDGRFNPGPGSLGAVVPATLRVALEQAGSDIAAAVITWRGAGGRLHPMRVCRVADATRRQAPAAGAGGAPGPADFEPIPPEAIGAASVTAVTEAPMTSGHEAEAPDRRAARLVGTLVHRLLRYGVPSEDLPSLRQRVAALVRPDESEAVHELAPVVAEAAGTYAALRAREDVRALLAGGETLFEIPFSWRLDDTTLLRGVIDCVIARPDGSLVVVDFKTGRAHPSHQAQLDAYVRAVESLYPGHRVEGALVYTK